MNSTFIKSKPDSPKWLAFNTRLPWPKDYSAIQPKSCSPCCEPPLYDRNGKRTEPAKVTE